jgi:hypothetical protein
MSPRSGHDSIFISYRREETAAQAGRLYDRLSDRFGEDRIFMDVDSIALGLDFTRAITEAVSECDIMLVLIGNNWSTITDSTGTRRIDNPNDWVRVEIETALKRDIRVVPVLIDGAPLPQANDLPESLRSLTRRQTLELTHTGFRSEVTRLLAAVDQIFQVGPDRPAETPKAVPRAPVIQQGKWQLELLTSKGSEYTFRLWSDQETYAIALNIGLPGGLYADGERIGGGWKAWGINEGQEYRAGSLSSKLGYDVTFKVWGFIKLKSLTVKIGDQVLTYNSGIK